MLERLYFGQSKCCAWTIPNVFTPAPTNINGVVCRVSLSIRLTASSLLLANAESNDFLVRFLLDKRDLVSASISILYPLQMCLVPSVPMCGVLNRRAFKISFSLSFFSPNTLSVISY